MSDSVEPLRPPSDTAPVRSLHDLERHWRMVKGPWGFSGPQLFCQFFAADGTVLPIIVNVGDCPTTPDGATAEQLFARLAEVVDDAPEPLTVAVMFARPGLDRTGPADRAWAHELTHAARASSLEVWPVFLANESGVRIVSPDDLAA